MLRCSDSSLLCHSHRSRSRGSAPASASGWRQQVLGQDGGEVLGGRGHGQPVARVDAFQPPAPAQDARLPAVDQPLPGEVPVEEFVDAPVRRLLADEGLHLAAKRCALRQLGGSAARPMRTASMKICSPAGKLIDSALKKAVRKASPPFQRRAIGVRRSTSRRRTTRRAHFSHCRGVVEHAHPRAGRGRVAAA